MTAERSLHHDIGLIGIGLLGSAIADRLKSAGRSVRGYDIDPTRVQAFSDQGGISSCVEEIFRQCRCIILSLPTSTIVASVFEAFRSDLSSGAVVIDTTTGVPADAISAARSIAQVGAEYVEATVAGSSVQLRKGTANLFVGGDGLTVRNVKSVLDILAPQHFHLGAVGSASQFKLVHNLILGLHRAVLAEGLTFAEAFGFDPATTLSILKQTPAASVAMETKGQSMITRDYSPQARLDQHLKDVRLILAEAAQRDIVVPLSQLHESLLRKAEELGFGASDNSAVIEAFRAKT